MCGVFGFIAQSPVPDAERILTLGMQIQKHRGPDANGSWLSPDRRVGLAHVRLSIIDIESGAQPMIDAESGVVISYNGEIYNYLELKKELEGVSFHTHSDTEVILQAYLRWGAACLSKLRGMFAILIWDPRHQQLFFARDRFGIKPLYWTRQADRIFFASEVKALLPFIAERRISKQALAEYFTFQFIISGSTLLEGVNDVPAAHQGTVNHSGDLRVTRYWEVRYEPDLYHTDAYFVEKLRELMSDSVSKHLRADVEVGAYVSGGLDSSLVAILAREERSGGSFRIFNGRFDEGEAYDESRYALAVAEENGMTCYVRDIVQDDFVDNIEKIIYHLDGPVAGPGAFPQFMISKLASTHLKVLLGGQGGDEIFGGYARYLLAYFEQCILGAIDDTLHNGKFIVTYESIIPNLVTLREYKPLLQEFWAAGLFGPRDERYFRLINRSNTLGSFIATDSLPMGDVFAAFKKIFWGENVGPESYFDHMTHFDFKTLLPALLQVEDRMSMAHGLESRVPFLDHPIVEFAATMPPNIKFANGELKRLLRAAFAYRLPEAVRNRKDKMGFPVPLNQWFNSGGRVSEYVRDTLGSSRARAREYIAPDANISEALSHQGAFNRSLWGLLSLELWQQQFIDTPSFRDAEGRISDINERKYVRALNATR